ncbi:MAG: FAD-binding protein [Syntrophaceae bacterium]|nr:FAD-binding protein [Syntrophaceae bacterium]
MEIIKTDVLIIGGGGAGIRAALAAREKGAEVLLVSKTPPGKSTCTYLSAGAFSLAAGGVSEEAHFKNTFQAGKGINDLELVKILVEEAPKRVRELEGFGLKGVWRKGRFHCLGKAPSWGAPLTEALANAARGRGIAEKPWVVIFDLLRDEEQVVGALGYEFRKGIPIAFLAKATVLANGGGGALYPRNDNPVRTTGDGYALAFEAGCRLRDMEFVQFLPIGLAEEGSPAFLIAPSLADAGKVVNSSGEDVLQKYQIVDRPVAVRCRDTFSQAIIKEEEKGEKVFLDLRHLGDEDWPQDNTALSQKSMFRDRFSCADRPLRIYPMVHFFIGGVSADPDGKTEVQGLWAAGEVVGGLHGANRMGGNALSEIIVFGSRAGAAAAEWALRQTPLGEADSLIQSRWARFQKKWKSNGKGLSPKALRKRLGEILWNRGGVLREEKGLQTGLEELSKIKSEDLPWAASETPKETLEKIEVDNGLRVAEMILRSALVRRESRGAHYRKDFPVADDRNWKGNIFLKKSEAKMTLTFQPLPGKSS